MTMTRRTFLAGTAALVAFAAVSTLPLSAARDRDQWVKLGEVTVHGKVDRDSIVLPAATRYEAVRFHVKGSALELHDVVIVFANGEKFSPSTKLVFGKGDESRVIDLPGHERNIERITFRYENLPGGGRATLAVWGKR